jgi:PAS domain S-box-containing protein
VRSGGSQSHGIRQRIVKGDTSTVRALRESEERYRNLVEEIGEWICEVDENFVCTYSSPRVRDILGYEPAEVVGRRAFDFMPPGEIERVMPLIGSGFDMSEGFSLFECTLLRKDGSPINIEISGKPVYDARGKVTCNRGVIRDVSERTRAEAALRESEEKFRALAETTPAGIVLYRGERFIYVSPVLEEISGYKRKELLDKKFWDLVHPDDRDTVRDRGLARQRGQPVPYHYEARILARDGEEKWMEFSAGLINYAGEPAGIATLYDITERKLVEEAPAEAKATAELYLDLMGHDINNMNQISLDFMEMARHKMEIEGKLTMDDVYLVDKAIESVRNSSNLIRNVRKLQQAKLGVYGPEVTDLGKMLIEVAAQHEDIPGQQVSINRAAKPAVTSWPTSCCGTFSPTWWATLSSIPGAAGHQHTDERDAGRRPGLVEGGRGGRRPGNTRQPERDLVQSAQPDRLAGPGKRLWAVPDQAAHRLLPR